MKKVLFVCSGNVCRSPMAEFVFLELCRRRGVSEFFSADSAGTTVFAPNSPIHPNSQKKMRKEGIPFCTSKGSRQVQEEDMERFDWIFGMDSTHLSQMRDIFGTDSDKLYRLLDFSDHPRNIADPWYTGNYEEAYADILEGCESFLNVILEDTTQSRKGAKR